MVRGMVSDWRGFVHGGVGPTTKHEEIGGARSGERDGRASERDIGPRGISDGPRAICQRDAPLGHLEGVKSMLMAGTLAGGFVGVWFLTRMPRKKRESDGSADRTDRTR